MPEVSVLLALVYGALSFASPCVLPLIPVYLANISGAAASQDRTARWRVFSNSLAFVLGFTIMFAMWGAGAGVMGSTLTGHLPLLRRLVGWLLIAFGIVMLASLRVPWLNFEKRLRLGASSKAGVVRSLLMGAVFPVAWTPCSSWVLGSILLLAGSSQSAARGALLLAAYSAGLGIPFLAVGLGLNYLAPILRKANRISSWFYIISSILLIAVGVLLVTNRTTWFLGSI
jgi:cytochrome c-type biogenesis protein